MKLSELFEARRNPEQNLRVSAAQQLMKYKDDPNIFIHFSPIIKLGVYPKSSWTTPIGIYFYPLKTFWEQYKLNETSDLSKTFTYGASMPYIHVIKYNGQGQRFISDISKYTMDDMRADETKLRKLGYDVDAGYKIMNEKNAFGMVNTFDSFWHLIHFIPKLNPNRQPVKAVNPETQKVVNVTKDTQTVDTNIILRQLGYAYISEPQQTGVIHDGEKSQGFFTSTKYIKKIDLILNKVYTDKPHLKPTKKVEQGGGLVVGEIDGKTLILSPIETQKQLTWPEADEYCNNLTYGGHNDWRLPTKDEMELMIKNLATIQSSSKYKLMDEYNDIYWGEQVKSKYGTASVQCWFKSKQSSYTSATLYKFYVRAVRTQ
jgi:hypothetical protein